MLVSGRVPVQHQRLNSIYFHKSPARDEATCQKPGVWSLLFAGGPLRPGRDFAREKYAKPKMKETGDPKKP